MQHLSLILWWCAPAIVLGEVLQVNRACARSEPSPATLHSASSTTSIFSHPTPSSPPTVNSSEYDLSKHFCRIWRHQSTYADGKIYIDGGNTYVPDNNGTFSNTANGSFEQGMNDGLLVLDLSRNFTNQDTFPYKMLEKGPQIPNTLIEGALWYSQVTRKVYQLGGWYSFNNPANPGFVSLADIPESAIWEFDIDTQTWAQSSFTLVNTGHKIDRPGAAANCDAPTLNMSFIFEGYVQQRSDHDYTNYTKSSEFKFEEGMLQLDTTTSSPTLTNISVPTYVGPRMNGAMVHIPVGSRGVIVQIGGQTTLDDTPFGLPIANANAGNININMSYVDIYDLESGYWFRQDTFGVPDLPTGRSDICTILVSAQDGSSYNIFMIAGVETYDSVIAYEDMWVLTLPTFQWVKVHTRNGGRYGHTCHAVGENLIIIGGMETTSSGGNVNSCNSHMPAEIFSLAEMNYTGIFDFEGSSRPAPVPADVVSLIGGTATGGAVVRAPKVWSDLYLQYVFDPTLTRPAYTPTYQLANITATPNSATSATSQPNPGENTGAIIGGVLGAVAILIILATIIGCCLRRRKLVQGNAAAAASRNRASELPSYYEFKPKSPVEIDVSPHFERELGSAPYQTNAHDPVELQGEGYNDDTIAHSSHSKDKIQPGDMPGEEVDELGVLSTAVTVTSPTPPFSPLLWSASTSSGSAGPASSATHSPQMSASSMRSSQYENASPSSIVTMPARPYVIPRKSVASGYSGGRASRHGQTTGLS